MYVRSSIVLLVVLAACTSTPSANTTAPPTTAGDQTTTTVSDSTTTTTTGQTTTTVETTTTTTSPTTTTLASIPGDIIDFGPREGDQLMVVGVAFDDVLNLRELPGVPYEIVSEIPPTAKNVFAHGITRQLSTSFWIAVEHGNFAGWVNYRFVGYEGQTDDATSEVVADLGELPTAETVLNLGMIVAETFASSDEPVSSIVVVEAPTLGDLGEVTIDVIGLGDDALLGFRLHVFAQPDGDGFGLKSVERTIICGRGITSDGLCP